MDLNTYLLCVNGDVYSAKITFCCFDVVLCIVYDDSASAGTVKEKANLAPQST